ncbi:hypothetical protein B0H13DRAFT_2353951 [Mycena leptocephala]|nr:hypothetical protein B0H13DRAFT_2353951 [Mycena leptocephala]
MLGATQALRCSGRAPSTPTHRTPTISRPLCRYGTALFHAAFFARVSCTVSRGLEPICDLSGLCALSLPGSPAYEGADELEASALPSPSDSSFSLNFVGSAHLVQHLQHERMSTSTSSAEGSATTLK